MNTNWPKLIWTAAAERSATPPSDVATFETSPALHASQGGFALRSATAVQTFVFIRVHSWLFRYQGQPDAKTTPAAVARLVKHIAAMRAGNLAGQRQAEAGTLDAAAQGIVCAIKLFENLFAAATRHADAAIQHAHLGAGQGTFAATGLQRDLFLLAAIL